MSLLSTLAPVQAAAAAQQNGSSLQNSSTTSPGQAQRAENQPAGHANHLTGGTTAAETSQAAIRIPPVAASRPSNAVSTTRAGAEGRALPDTDMTSELDEERARVEDEASRRKVMLKELLSRIPVPVEAIPKLTGDVEMVRTIGEHEDHRLESVA